jgi:hypothetical protein
MEARSAAGGSAVMREFLRRVAMAANSRVAPMTVGRVVFDQ